MRGTLKNYLFIIIVLSTCIRKILKSVRTLSQVEIPNVPLGRSHNATPIRILIAKQLKRTQRLPRVGLLIGRQRFRLRSGMGVTESTRIIY